MEQRSPKKTKDQRSLREKATSVVQKLQAAGHEAYFAGGFTNALLRIQPKDYDIATVPQTVQELFRKTIPIGIQFGVIQVRYGGGFEVATFQTTVDTPMAEDQIRLCSQPLRPTLKDAILQ